MLFAAGTRHAMARGMLGAARNVRNAYSGRRLVAPTRRAVLAVAATAAAAGSASLAGCKGLAALNPPPAPGPAVLALEHSIVAEVRWFDATVLQRDLAVERAGDTIAVRFAHVWYPDSRPRRSRRGK